MPHAVSCRAACFMRGLTHTPKSAGQPEPAFMKRTLLSWSSGKDSAWSLHLLRQKNEYEIVGLLTTFNQSANRVAMHAVRRSLVEAQAKAAGIALWDVDLPHPCSNAEYERIMRQTCKAAVQSGIEYIAFGDLLWKAVFCTRQPKAVRTRKSSGNGSLLSNLALT